MVKCNSFDWLKPHSLTANDVWVFIYLTRTSQWSVRSHLTVWNAAERAAAASIRTYHRTERWDTAPPGLHRRQLVRAEVETRKFTFSSDPSWQRGHPKGHGGKGGVAESDRECRASHTRRIGRHSPAELWPFICVCFPFLRLPELAGQPQGASQGIAGHIFLTLKFTLQLSQQQQQLIKL